ncbi:MAG TPA: MarR family winged helix-turn-helix transcriptional regulator [Sulfuricurvum sp.]|nr:MarR family winged helix-turn-helix transcriptional regulator [Sulfuricurvum sp.]
MKRPKGYGIHEDKVLRAHIELSRAFIKIRAKETAWMEAQGLTLPQFAILEALYHLGPLNVGQITKLILSTPGNITVVVKNLEAKKLLTVTLSQTDRRVKILEITAKGAEIIRSIFPIHVKNLQGWYDAGLDEQELEVVSKLLRKLEKAQ